MYLASQLDHSSVHLWIDHLPLGNSRRCCGADMQFHPMKATFLCSRSAEGLSFFGWNDFEMTSEIFPLFLQSLGISKLEMEKPWENAFLFAKDLREKPNVVILRRSKPGRPVHPRKWTCPQKRDDVLMENVHLPTIQTSRCFFLLLVSIKIDPTKNCSKPQKKTLC